MRVKTIYIFHVIFVHNFLFFILKVMHLVFFFAFFTRSIMYSFPIYRRHFSNCKQNVGAGIDSSMPISDGIGRSIFCRKMEKARTMREDMEGKVVYFPPDSAFFTLKLLFVKYVSLFVPLISRQGKGINRRNENTVD